MTKLARRQVLTSLAATPFAGLALAAVLADPNLARAAAAGLEEVSLITAGGRRVSAALAVPAKTPAAAIVLIHEWWGLNDQIKAVAAEFAREGYVALAVDLYGGNVAGTRDGARALMQALDGAAATDTLTSWIAWLRKRGDTTGKMGTIGWCFGGGWSLAAAIAAPVDATVIYYGRVNHPPASLASLKGPVLGHFATPRPVDRPGDGRRLRKRHGRGPQTPDRPLVRGRPRLRQPLGRALRQGRRAIGLAAHAGIFQGEFVGAGPNAPSPGGAGSRGACGGPGSGLPRRTARQVAP